MPMAPRLANTLVIDNGASTIKAGFATRSTTIDDCQTIPNCIARTREKKTLVGKQVESCKDYGSIMFRQPVEKGHLVNWEVEKEIWDRTFLDDGALLHCDPKSTTLVLTEAPNVTPALQTNCDQMIFEEYEFGAYYRCIGSSLVAWNNTSTLFNHSATTHHSPSECVLVVDTGYSFTHVTPILHGSVYHPAVRRIDVGGKVMTNYLKEIFSIRQYNMMDETYIVNEIKEATCFVSTDFRADLDRVRREKKCDIVLDYVLPDYTAIHKGIVRPHKDVLKTGKGVVGGQDQVLTVGNERFLVPELLFYPGDVGYRQAGLPEAIMQSIEKVPETYRPSLLANIVLVGGTAKTPGFKERLETELRPLAPEHAPLRIQIPDDPIRYIWQGGVALANNKTALDQRRVTRAEYQEHGSTWLARKFNTQTISATNSGSGAQKRRRESFGAS